MLTNSGWVNGYDALFKQLYSGGLLSLSARNVRRRQKRRDERERRLRAERARGVRTGKLAGGVWP